MSFAQRRLWFLDQLEPGNPFYNLPLAVPFLASVHAAVLERSVNELVKRHEALRTVFSVSDGEPMQVILPTLAVPLETADLRDLPAEAREAEVTRLAAEMAQRPFDLTRGPLLRTALVRRDAQDYVFLLTMHHIISDGWSLGVFWRELVALYNAFYMGRPSPLPELPIQYADFAVWQKQRLQGEIFASLLGYWKKRLAGLPVLQLPTDRPRPAVLSYRGAFQELGLSRPLAAGLKALSQQEGATLFMTLLAAFATLLQRYGGQTDIVVGSYVASRDRAELEGLIGFFVNSLVLRVDLSGDPSFRELLGRVREMALGAYAHQELPFEKLVEELQPERDLSRNPLFQVTFQLFSTPEEGKRSEATKGTTIEINRGMAIFDLAVNLWEGPEGLGGHIEYSTDLFEAATIERLANHFRVLLKGIVARPEERLSQLPLLTEGEKRQLLVEWNATDADYPARCVHELFAEQAQRTPGAVAVVAGGKTLHYAELERRSNQLAQRLRLLGVEHQTLVAVCVERGLHMVVGLLAVLKAGGAYVPLDPAYPRERLAFMLADSGAKVLLTERSAASHLPTYDGTVLHLDEEEIYAGMNDQAPGNPATLDSLCYVIYTSGSTGKPKGVEVEHRGLVNLATWHNRFYQVCPQDRATQLASISFDASAWELWPYLITGASVHVVDAETRAQHSELARYMASNGITLSFLATPLAELFLQEMHSGLLLRALLTGGDRLHRCSPSECKFQLVNHYGPTEDSVVTTAWPFPENNTTSPLIGRPIANTEVYVLDAHRQPVPVGVPGELYIGGAGLARGYHQRPELTAEHFLANPFSSSPAARLYKTGDLVRYRPDGNLEFLGRLDHQVKIRGFRIELGEIESALAEHPSVRDAAVTLRTDDPGPRLVAYVAASHPLSPGLLRAHLQERLPDYMLPSAYVFLETLPQTANGKVDRAILPAPDSVPFEKQPHYVAPRDAVEQALADLWAEVLKVDRVGIHDNFFEIGGHSLLATQLVSRVRSTLRVEIPLQALFRAPSVEAFAAILLQDATRKAKVEKTAQLIAKIKHLSDREVQQMLSAKTSTGS